MFCRHCGAQIPDDSIFCERCGARLSDAAPAAAPQPDMYAGSRQAPPPAYSQPVYPQQNYAPQYGAPGGFGMTGELIYDAGKVTVYNGGGAIGVVYGAGNLFIYDDRIEFEKTSGSQAGFALGAVAGLALSKLDANKNPVDVWYMADIADVHIAKHAGVISKLVIQFHGKKAYSVTLTGRGSKTNQMIEEMCDVIRQYI